LLICSVFQPFYGKNVNYSLLFMHPTNVNKSTNWIIFICAWILVQSDMQFHLQHHNWNSWALMPLWDVICFLQILFIFEPLLCRKWFPFWLTCADTVSFHRFNPWPDQPIITNQINQSQLTKSTNHNCLVISLLTVALKQNNDENNYIGFNLKNRIRSFKAITTPDCKTTTNCRYFLAWITHLQAIFT